MNPVGPKYTNENIEQLEREIIAKIDVKQNEVFGDRKVEILEGDPRLAAINEFVTDLVIDFPCTDEGTRFINCQYSVIPIIVVQWLDLNPILEQQHEGNLFHDEVGKTIKLNPISNPNYGNITEESQALELRNIRFLPDSRLRPNEMTVEKVKEKSPKNGSAIFNRESFIGTFNIDPSLLKTKMVADIRFGDFVSDNCEIKVETHGDEATTKLLITLPSLVGKIKHDGSVTLSNGSQFKIVDVGLNFGGSIFISSPINYKLMINVVK